MKFVTPPVVHSLIVNIAVIMFLANPLFAASADDAAKATAVLLDLNAKKYDRIAAAQELEKSGRGSSQVAQALTRTLGDSDPEVRGWAAVILVHMSRRSGTDLAAPIEGTEQFFLTNGPAQYGAEIEPALPILLEALRGSEPGLSLVATQTLEAVGTAASKLTGELAKALKDKVPSVRWEAADVLAAIGPAAKDTIPDITAALQDTDPTVRKYAASALGKFGASAKGSVVPLKNALKDADLDVRFHVAQAVVDIDGAPSADAVLPVLLESLKDHSSVSAQIIAANALSKIGPAARGAVPGLVAELAAEAKNKGGLRGAAAEALGRIGDKSAIPALAKALSDEDPGIRAEAAVALLRIDPKHREAAELLQSQLKGADQDDRQAAAEGLLAAGLSVEPAVRVLLDAAHNGGKTDRFNALSALRGVRPEHAAAVPLLVEALADADVDVRTTAAIGLGNIGLAARTEASPKLQQTSKQDPQESVRAAAKRALDALDAGDRKP
ncbi:MAG: lyase domain protein repeat-containing protein [Phycisphaerales bacterium]|nr:lyase domain protein repeat-containing protein [Phycisphaerales bacterium]